MRRRRRTIACLLGGGCTVAGDDAGPLAGMSLALSSSPKNDRDRRVDLDVLGALGDQDLLELPSSTASTSIVALSVSISAMTMPEVTVSPSLIIHLASLPSSMVGDSAGIRICVGI